MNGKENLPELRRHGTEYHGDYGLRGSQVILQNPFLCHPDSTVTIQTNAEEELSIQSLLPGHFFCKYRIFLNKILQHILPERILRSILVCPFVKKHIILHLLHTFITHHTVSGKNLTGPAFLARKDSIVAALDHEIRQGDLDLMAQIRKNKRTL